MLMTLIAALTSLLGNGGAKMIVGLSFGEVINTILSVIIVILLVRK